MLITIFVSLIRKSRKWSFPLKVDMAKLVRISFPGSNKLTWHLLGGGGEVQKDDMWNVQTVSIHWDKA